MKLNEFMLERLFSRLRPGAKYILSPSSCESCTMKEILDLADAECRKLWENLDLGYNDYRGHVKLREAVTRRYRTLGVDDILVVTPEEGIFIALNVLLDPGDEVIVIHPTLPSMHEIPKSIGCTVIPWVLESTDWGWRLDTDFLNRTISSKTKLIVLNIPNNPTGYMPVLADIQRIANIADKTGAWILCEETYRGMEHDPGVDLPSMADIYPRAIALGGVNKIGLAGSRIGWLASQNRSVMAECFGFKDYTTLCPSASSEILALIAMRNFSYLAERNRKIILENVELAEGFFNSKPEWFNWSSPNGGSTAFPKLNYPYKVSDLCDRAAADASILVIPDRIFSISDNRFRIGFGRKNFGQALAMFTDFMDKFTARDTAEEQIA
ncbi:MAG: aminotransferase class I/II-fold pyridoxal phosphate-dependent enzyme [Synergistaceae bacterium]|nr:aminotransferase class I/II-fold pyridoxal phosphate-dependent enzyme [Synergistaceae bacterium]